MISVGMILILIYDHVKIIFKNILKILKKNENIFLRFFLVTRRRKVTDGIDALPT